MNAPICDGYDSPVGTAEERASAQLWPGDWFNAAPFAKLYLIGTPRQAYHTGIDFNRNKPRWDSDAHQPVYACASGVVTFCAELRVWGQVIVIRHDPLPDGTVLYSRYGHVEAVKVATGMRVERGQQLAAIGNANGKTVYHLHFDLSPTEALALRPGDWPWMDKARVLRDYVDPLRFILVNRPK